MKKVKSVLMYVTSGCGDCVRAKDFFEKNAIGYEGHNIEEEESLTDAMFKLNGEINRVPTIQVTYEDGSKKVLIEPSNRELKEAFGIDRKL